MKEFFDSFNGYVTGAAYDSMWFWVFPLGTLGLIWILTVVATKVFKSKGKLTTVFVINRIWIASSLIVAGLLVSLISFWWSTGYFIQYPFQFSLLLSLAVSMIVSLVYVVNLRSYYTTNRFSAIAIQPKTLNQFDNTSVFAKRAFRKNKLFYLAPLLGFSFLLIHLNQGVNLISIIYDNSQSMAHTDVISALSETFDNLQENNEVSLTTIDGYSEDDILAAKKTMQDIMNVAHVSDLKAGNVMFFNNPLEAKNRLSDIPTECNGSPICESVWKTYLDVKDRKQGDVYKNKVLIILSDGDDNLVGSSVSSGKFFFDDEGFTDLYPVDKVFIIDYSNGAVSTLNQRFENAGADIYPAENNKLGYLDALDNALLTFKDDWYLVYWTVLIVVLFTGIGILIQPKKMM